MSDYCLGGERLSVAASMDKGARLLAPYRGERPPAPGWFEWATAQQPKRGIIEVAGANIEYLSWGRHGAPGMLMMHGHSAHAGWWRHIAPFLADRRHVVALSWSGMGSSDWRAQYSTRLMMEEALAVMYCTGLLADGDKPTLVAHSLGALACLRLALEMGDRFAGAILVDANIDGSRRKSRNLTATHKGRIYPTLAAGLSRFRFIGSVGQELPYVADLFAREGLTPVATVDEPCGWRWCFDPLAFDRLEIEEIGEGIADIRCPLALIYGADSPVVPPQHREKVLAMAPDRTRLVVIPDCGHHVMAEQPLALIASLQALG